MLKPTLRTRLSILAATALVVTAVPALAGDTFRGKITDVSDGDTVVVGSGGRVRVVQIAGIDAPELSQEYGDRARDFVKQMAKGKRVELEVVERTSPQNLVARITIDGQDLASALVEAGLAWSDQSSSTGLKTAQQKAKSDGLGLWAATDPTPPWEYRKNA